MSHNPIGLQDLVQGQRYLYLTENGIATNMCSGSHTAKLTYFIARSVRYILAHVWVTRSS
jgi:hypothetical protein